MWVVSLHTSHEPSKFLRFWPNSQCIGRHLRRARSQYTPTAKFDLRMGLGVVVSQNGTRRGGMGG